MARKRAKVTEICGLTLPQELLTPISTLDLNPDKESNNAFGLLTPNPNSLIQENIDINSAKLKRIKQIIKYVSENSDIPIKDDFFVLTVIAFDLLSKLVPGLQINFNKVGRRQDWSLLRCIELAICFSAAFMQENIKTNLEAASYVVDSFPKFSTPESTVKRKWIRTLVSRYTRNDFQRNRNLIANAVLGYSEEEGVLPQEAISYYIALFQLENPK